ncbi:class I SAM-dependent methyltransferase [Patescibacteria group bacterium]
MYIYNKFNIKDYFRILDIGCGPGHNLIHFNQDSVGIEINNHIADFGSSLGLNIIRANVEDELPVINGRFDLVWCTDFLVHMVSPFRFLFKIRKYLDNESYLIIQIPKPSIFKTHESPEHFYAFNKEDISYLLKMAGYKIVDFSGYIRTKPNYLNKIFESLLQRFGANIWILAKKDKRPNILDKTFLPSWF